MVDKDITKSLVTILCSVGLTREGTKELWGVLLNYKPNRADYTKLIGGGINEEVVYLAWKQLMESKPTNHNLCWIISRENREPRVWAWEQLLNQEPTMSDLSCVACFGYEDIKEEAWDLFLGNSPSVKDLRSVVLNDTSNYGKKALGLILQKDPSNSEVGWLSNFARRYQ